MRVRFLLLTEYKEEFFLLCKIKTISLNSFTFLIKRSFNNIGLPFFMENKHILMKRFHKKMLCRSACVFCKKKPCYTESMQGKDTPHGLERNFSKRQR